MGVTQCGRMSTMTHAVYRVLSDRAEYQAYPEDPEKAGEVLRLANGTRLDTDPDVSVVNRRTPLQVRSPVAVAVQPHATRLYYARGIPPGPV